MNKEFWTAVFSFTSISIGAGVLALPYIFHTTGFMTGISILIVTALVLLIVYYYLGEIVLRTKGKHHLAGLAEKYLGKTGKTLMFLFSSVGIYGALLAYIIASGEILNYFYKWNATHYSLLYFIFMSLVLFYGLRIFTRTETILSVLKII